MQFDSLLLHSPIDQSTWQGATLVPIFQSAAFAHPDAESLSAAFTGQTSDPIYTRLSNPTTSALEARLAAVEGGVDALATASGMAAVAHTCLALVSAGDEFVAVGTVFLSTFNLFDRMMAQFGVKCRFVEGQDPGAVERAMCGRTRFVYAESLAIPSMVMPDVPALAAVAHRWGVPLIVDNTSLSPAVANPIRDGADVVIHSTTKFIAGHGSASGGIIIDAGTFAADPQDGRVGPAATRPSERAPRTSLLMKIWKDQAILQGATPSPHSSFLTMLGLQTMSLRVRQAAANAAAVAEHLAGRAETRWVRYPGTAPGSGRDGGPAGADRRGKGTIIAFSLRDQEACFAFIRSLEMIHNLANIGDCRTLIIHPFSSQYAATAGAEKERQGIEPGYIRLCVGIEDVRDIVADLDRGFAALGRPPQR